MLADQGRSLGMLAFAPAIDPDTLPRHPLEAVRDGSARDVALLVGANRDESKLFRMGMAASAELDEAGLAKRVRASLRAIGADEAHAERLIVDLPQARARAARRPSRSSCSTRSTPTAPSAFPRSGSRRRTRATQPRSYQYFFTWCSPARRGTLGACHALELPFVFGTLDAPTMDRFAGNGPEAEALSARMMDAWIAFARSGEPGPRRHSRLARVRHRRARPTLVFDRDCALAHAPLDAERAAWDGVI